MNALESFKAGYGQRIATSRKAAALTQKQVADDIGVNKLTVCHWEKERQTPTAHIVRLSQVLKVSPVWLMFGYEEGDQVSAMDDIKNTVQAVVDTGASNTAAKILPIDNGGYWLPMLGVVAAGNGSVVDPGREEDRVPDRGSGAHYALTIKGDSMEPLLTDGSTVYIKRAELTLPPFEDDKVPFQVPAEKVQPFAGKICVVSLNGAGLIKRLEVMRKKGGRYWCLLKSINRKHGRIKVSSSDECRIQGVAVSVYHNL